MQTSSTEPTQNFYLIAATAILLLLAMGISYAIYDRRSLLAGGEESARQIAEQTALAADGALDTAQGLLDTMTVLVRPPTPDEKIDPAAVRDALLRLRAAKPQVMDLLILNGAGKILHWTGSGVPPDVRDREYYTTHIANAGSGLYVGQPSPSKVRPGKWFFAISRTLRDAQGNVDHVLAITMDVSLLHEHLGVRFAIPGSSQVLLSETGVIYTRNPEHERYVGKSISQPHEFSTSSANESALTFRMVSELDQRERVVSFRRLGKYPLIAVGTVPIDSVLTPWWQRIGIIGTVFVLLSLGILWTARRVMRIEKAQSELANIDSLTGTYNRRSIISKATRLDRSQAHVGSLSLLMADVDHFKDVNDRFGHLVGDEVLRQLSRILRTNCRATDIVGRFGGEEFLVLMPDTGSEGAAALAEKLRAAVESRLTKPVPVTISIGVATTSESDQSLDWTLSRADKALYAAKAAGRNCVRVAGKEAARPEPALP